MPTERRPRSSARPSGARKAPVPPSTPDEPVPIEPGTTGRLLVLLDDGADARATSRSLARARRERLVLRPYVETNHLGICDRQVWRVVAYLRSSRRPRRATQSAASSGWRNGHLCSAGE